MDQILLQPLSSLGVPSNAASALLRLGIKDIGDLLLHRPHSYITKNVNPDLSRLSAGQYITTDVIIKDIQFPKKSGTPTKVYAENTTGSIVLVFFHKIPKWILNSLYIGSKKTIDGKVEWNDFYYQIVHPEFILDKNRVTSIEPVYPLTYGISNRQTYSYILKALDALRKSIPEGKAIKSFVDSIRYIHTPDTLEHLEKHTRNLAYYELLSNQLSLASLRMHHNKRHGISFVKAHTLQEKALQNLTFTLSDGQSSVLQEIEDKQSAPLRMNHMLQGDVGSGKTLVALMSILNVVHAEVQSALMVPTDILANQHFNFFTKALADTGITIGLLTGKTKTKDKTEVLRALANGEMQILIGTHALFQSKVIFKNLGYIVIDEQHKFGVMQRMELLNKAQYPDLLIMTATPIPRSITMTLFGDMSVSKLTSKPASRPEIITIIKSRSKVHDIIDGVHRKIDTTEKVYWICPLVEQVSEEDSDAKVQAAINRFETLRSVFHDKVGLIHGKMRADEKDRIMQDFKDGKISILVATTVIEVGIDVPDATLMVIENAEKFGLAQLHQLRGRVGRGSAQSHCILLYEYLAGMVKTRLEIMRNSQDGFYIAEQDLVLRGGGEILGTKQSGNMEFKFADLAQDTALLAECNKLAEHCILKQDVGVLNANEIEFFVKIFGNDLVVQGGTLY